MEKELSDRLDDLSLRLEAIAMAEAEEREKLWLAYKGVAGIEGLTTGLAYIAELVQPLKQLVPPSTAQPLPDGVGEAVENIRATLETPVFRFEGRLPVPDWDGPISYIGQALPFSQQSTNATGLSRGRKSK